MGKDAKNLTLLIVMANALHHWLIEWLNVIISQATIVLCTFYTCHDYTMYPTPGYTDICLYIHAYQVQRNILLLLLYPYYCTATILLLPMYCYCSTTTKILLLFYCYCFTTTNELLLFYYCRFSVLIIYRRMLTSLNRVMRR